MKAAKGDDTWRQANCQVSATLRPKYPQLPKLRAPSSCGPDVPPPRPLTSPRHQRIMQVLIIAGQGGPSPAPFPLIWGVVALVGRGALVTRRVPERFRAMVIEGLATKPTQQARAEAVPLGFARFFGGVFVVCGMVAIPVSIAMMVRG